jgi:hypothetical protein
LVKVRVSLPAAGRDAGFVIGIGFGSWGLGFR